jgi:hypothetical protein
VLAVGELDASLPLARFVRLSLPFEASRLKRLQVVFRQFNRLLAPVPSPAITFNAAEKTLTVVVDFDQRLIALFAANRTALP